jgi:protein involved in polysaccharide export with SLBB domain
MIASTPENHRTGWATCVALVFIFIAFLWAPNAEAQTPSSPPVFRVGDAVRVTVWGNPEFSGQFDIAEDGTVIHPLYRAIGVAGLSLSEAETEFTRVLRRFLDNPEIVVEPLFRIPVGGEVRGPNIYTLPPYATLAEALTQAGGPMPNADLRRARLFRDGREMVVDLRHPDNEFANIRVRSGDQIILVPEVRIWRDRLEPTLRTAGAMASLAYLILRLTDRLDN